MSDVTKRGIIVPAFIIVIGLIILIRNWLLGIYFAGGGNEDSFNGNWFIFWPLIVIIIGVLLIVHRRTNYREKE